MRRILNQCANAAVKAKGTIFEMRLEAYGFFGLSEGL
jgi:hypothetical protein